MRLFLCVAWILCAARIGAGDSAGESDKLTLKPSGTSHIRAEGNPIMFTCEVAGAEDSEEEVNYNIKWFNDSGKEITDTTASRMYVEDDTWYLKKLYITTIVKADAGKYTCRATIDGETHSRSTELRVYQDTTFDNAPSPQNPKIYTDAVIHCAVSGEPMPTVSWRYGGKRISAGSRYKLENGKGLTIMNITQEDDGEYTCRAEVNADGRYSERKITVKVHIPPAITASPGKVDGIKGQSATLKCAASGLPKPKYEFIKVPEAMHLQSNDRITVDNDNGTVKFTELLKTDEGQYTCKALNDVGEDSAVGQLHVLVAPEIFELKNVTENEGGTATLVCRSHGDPRPTMSFRKAGHAESYEEGGNEDERIVVSRTDNMLQLVIKNVKPSDSADYICKSHSAIGHNESTGSLRVDYEPRFVKDLAVESYTWAGRTSNISCQANGSPTPSLQWLSGGHTLTNNDTFHIFDLGNASYLQITVQGPDQGWIYTTYVCRAENKLGSKDLDILLKRANVPSSPVAVNATNISPTSADLAIDEPEENGGMPVTHYVVEYEKHVIQFATGQPIKLKNLKASTNYTVQVRAKNEVGAGEPYDLLFITDPARRPYAIEVSSNPQGPRPYVYTVSWETPNTGGSPITSYQIKYRAVRLTKANNTEVPEPTSEWKTVTREERLDQLPAVEVQLSDLKEETSYEVEVLALNSIGWSDPNKRFIFTTSKAAAATYDRSNAARIVSIRLGSFVSIMCWWTIALACYVLNVF